MSKKSLEKIGSFTAIDEEGSEHRILVFQEFISGHTSSGPYRTEGMKQMRTDGGHFVNRNEKGKYSIPGLGDMQLTNDSPDAF